MKEEDFQIAYRTFRELTPRTTALGNLISNRLDTKKHLSENTKKLIEQIRFELVERKTPENLNRYGNWIHFSADVLVEIFDISVEYQLDILEGGQEEGGDKGDIGIPITTMGRLIDNLFQYLRVTTTLIGGPSDHGMYSDRTGERILKVLRDIAELDPKRRGPFLNLANRHHQDHLIIIST